MSINLELRDWRAVEQFDVGDTIFAHKPEAGLEDLVNEMDYQGRAIYPRGIRVLSRRWRLGSGPFRAELVRDDGVVIDLTNVVRWDRDTAASLGLGDFRPTFVVDPQGGRPGNQFRRYRASMPTR